MLFYLPPSYLKEFWWRKRLSIRISILPWVLTIRIPSQKIHISTICNVRMMPQCVPKSPVYGQIGSSHRSANPQNSLWLMYEDALHLFYVTIILQITLCTRMFCTKTFVSSLFLTNISFLPLGQGYCCHVCVHLSLCHAVCLSVRPSVHHSRLLTTVYPKYVKSLILM